MIKRTLRTPHTLHELYNKLSDSHTMQSLKIELDFLITIGVVGLDGNKYFYKRKSK
jgi:hypothetical protein